MTEAECHCGKGGHALGSINCPVHGDVQLLEVKWRELINLLRTAKSSDERPWDTVFRGLRLLARPPTEPAGRYWEARWRDEKAENELLYSAVNEIALLCSGSRPTVNPGNAFEHFSALNKRLVAVREVANRVRKVVATSSDSSDAERA